MCTAPCGGAIGRQCAFTMRILGLLFSLVTTLAAEHFSSQWAVHIEGGKGKADAIAERNGFLNLGEIFPDYYHFEHQRIAKRSIEPSLQHHNNLLAEVDVKWARQQTIKSRKKRDLISSTPYDPPVTVLNDVKWPQMWYLNRGNGLDMSVQGAWNSGITGKGIVVTILDDGLEKNHPDLINNYDPQASYDVNSRDDDPMPRYDLIDSNRHGTRCAGEVAATANNSLCAVGIAFGASVGGVRMLDGDVTDAVEARSLSLNPQHIDIYSASWGPDDDGKTVDGPGELALRAFIEGVTKGRSGKGSIFVWASGNGGRDHDNCNCDGYTNSIWTLSISSATENGLVPWYSEACSSTLATTYSSGSSGEKQIVTTDLHHQCTSGHTGTSASAPLAAGICALALEANSLLTWRDMQHIVVATARPANLKAQDWVTNGVGRNVSHSFGYGLMDATAMVRLARNWRTVPEQHKCEVSAPQVNKPIPAKSSVTLKLNVKECPGVNYLEHIQAKVTLMSQRRGDLQILLTSPAGTRTTLLARRPHDVSRAGFDSWPFMSVHTWGESPFGTWELEVHNEGRYLGRATLHEWALIFYGTESPPGYLPPQTQLRPPFSLNLPPLPRKNKASRKNKSANTTSKPNWKSSKESKTLLVPKSNQKVLPTFVPVTRKTPRPSVISARRPTPPPAASTTAFSIVVATPPFGLTIVLAPQLQPSHTPPHLIPAIFQKYPKIQQLFPLSKLPSKKGLQQEELTDARKPPGQLIDWKLIFYGTETAPQTSSMNPKLSTVVVTSPPTAIKKKPASPNNPDEWKDTSQQTNLSSDIHEDLYENKTHCLKPTVKCIECAPNLFLTKDGLCRRKCTEGTYPVEPNQCLRCHYTCLTCHGLNDYQCSSCHGDAELTKPSVLESYCYPKALLNQANSLTWYYRASIGLGINLLCLLFLGTYICIKLSKFKLSENRPASSKDSVKYKLTKNASDSD